MVPEPKILEFTIGGWSDTVLFCGVEYKIVMRDGRLAVENLMRNVLVALAMCDGATREVASVAVREYEDRIIEAYKRKVGAL